MNTTIPPPRDRDDAPERRTIVCLSPQEWRVDLPTNRQQIMTRVAARGYPVLFVETGGWAGRRLLDLVRRRGDGVGATGEPVAPGVRVLQARTLLPWGHRIRLAARLNAMMTARSIRARVLDAGRESVLWLYDPCFADAIGRSGEQLAVYDCVDDYQEQTGGDRRKYELVRSYDHLTASRSRVVFVTSRPLLERHRVTNPHTELVRNVGDYAHFAQATDRANVAPDIAGLQRPVIGFAGNFSANKVDFDLLEHVAEQRRDWTLLLVGPARPDTRERVDRLALHPNVDVVPGQLYQALPSYVAAFDVALIPYQSNAYTRSCFPLKTFEYLAAGKPVVAAGLPELAFLAPHVSLASGADEFVRSIEVALTRRSPEDVQERQEIAARNTWETRTTRLLELINAALEEDRLRLPAPRAATTLRR